MISSDDCGQVVAGNYDVIVNEPSLRSIITDYLTRFETREAELGETTCYYTNEFKLLKEYSRILKENKANLEEGENEYNVKKNRYKDIIPFNHTRVVLTSDPEKPGSGYINANYIRGPSGSPRAYIACQGPLSCTLIDFWRMIWECSVSVIIMACNEYESGKPKCEIYWPEQVDTSFYYGNFQITLLKVRHICSDFLIRKFSVKLLEIENNNCNTSSIDEQQQFSSNNNNYYTVNNPNDQHQLDMGYSTSSSDDCKQRCVLAERTICQFHYTTWPDHGVPDSVEPILELVRLVREVQPAEDKPLLVHCSAGCGRTGTICCIDYVWGLLRRGKLDVDFDLCSIISDMREQRMAMVQTLEQYILCHRAVAALFMKQLNLIEDHTYENLDSIEEIERLFEEQDLGPVFI